MQLARGAAEGLIVSTTEPTFLRNKSPEIEVFNNNYFKMFQKKPGLEEIYAARAYDAVMLLANGINTCADASPDCLKNYLYKVKEYPGVSGKISFDKNGDVSSKFELYVVKNGAFVLLPE